VLSVAFYIVTESVVGLNGVAPFFPLQKSRFLIFFSRQEHLSWKPFAFAKTQKSEVFSTGLIFFKTSELIWS